MLFKVVPLKDTNLVLVQTLTQNGLLKIGLQQQESGDLHVSQPLYALYYNISGTNLVLESSVKSLLKYLAIYWEMFEGVW